MDKALTLWINHDWAGPWADVIFSTLSSKWAFGIPLLIGVLFFLGWRYRLAGAKLALLLGLTVIVADGVGGVIKLAAPQPRPCGEIFQELRSVAGKSGPCETYHSGMPSNHTLNAFALFAFCTVIWRAWRWSLMLFVLASAVGLSRIYLGMHYPSQVVVGAVLGCIAGGVSAGLALRFSASAHAVRASVMARGQQIPG